ncbi:glycine--tRNA ligase subunit alpha [Sodalis-like secondary symbiont of Drepanosiphum platanoidis]|uniref:glycine--tRNA ligase subunit alpha n=1 Tax=Sodalis-like secondary symbiont of Drepanosiphum platanoidis TaxID=2994493 RepID=UPI003463F13A
MNKKKNNTKTFQGLIFTLKKYWEKNGCSIIQPLDMEVGAGTSHPMTFFKALGSKPISIAYVQPSRRPTDGRYGKSPNRLQKYYQFQVIIKPSPNFMQNLYLKSLKKIGINLKNNDISFLEDNWDNPTLGAWGLGWEVRLNGMEISQLTYFQKIGGLNCNPITGEITYGLERLSMHLQKKDNVYDIVWNNNIFGKITYKSFSLQNELEQSIYNFEYIDTKFLFKSFEKLIKQSKKMLSFNTPLIFPSYEIILKVIHIFNILDARQSFSFTERQSYILRIRNITKIIAKTYFNLFCIKN